MKLQLSHRAHLRLSHVAFVVLLLAVAGLLMAASRTYHYQFDWTHSGRNTLSPASISLLERLDEPVKITAYATERRELRNGLRELLARYQRHKDDITLEFVNPDQDPARAREANVQFDGELVIAYQDNAEQVKQASEETITNALARLARSGEKLVVFMGGHGERSADGAANHDYANWANQLRKRGLRIKTAVLSEGKIPANTGVLVIAGPRANLLRGEIKQIERYVNDGGNLLWLAEPGEQHGLDSLAELLGIEFLPGTIVDPASQALTSADPTFLVATNFGTHAATEGLTLVTLFPQSAGMRVSAPKGWQSSVLLDTHPSAWVETGVLEGEIAYDKGSDVAGPVNIAVALTREINDREQRVLVVGDGDFLSNSFLGNGGNLQLGMNLINWASHEDLHIDLPTRTTLDVHLRLGQTAQASIAIGSLIALPLALILAGSGIWWRRRRR